MDNLYLNYSVLSHIIGFFLMGVTSFSFLLIPKKSTNTLVLALILLTGMLLNFFYVISEAIYLPLKIPRIFNLLLIFFHHTIYIHFILRFPKLQHPKLLKSVYVIQLALFLLCSVFYVFYNLQSEMYYDFEGAFYKYNSSIAYKVYILGITIVILSYFLISFWKLYTLRKREIFFSYSLVIIAIFFTSILSMVMALLNSFGYLTRDMYTTSFSLGTILGVFLLIVAYMNETKDRTTFLYKVAGIGFVSFLVVFNIISYVVLQEKEVEWDKLCNKMLPFVIQNEYRTNEVGYVYRLNKNGEIDSLYSKKKNPNIIKTLKNEITDLYAQKEHSQNRHYRAQDKFTHYISYLYYDKAKDELYEVGFSYRKYREDVHNATLNLLYLLLFGIVIFTLGTPIFLRKTLVSPLKKLLTGIREAKSGKLDIHIPVKVSDEFGYLSQSFNEMISSIKDSKEQLQDYAQNLEAKVKERTQKLADSLEHIQKLKEQQDGDYFLTTLLIKPLTLKQTQSDKVKIDFFIKQKKEFKFRNRNLEIGGDICIAQDTNLKGKKYIAFLNADAMGKSIQGAGGILVLGSVFHSILQRTQTLEKSADVFPEVWVKLTFKEMQKVFESFEGSMLISLIFGLVEEETGVVYFINAEHPWMILYRDKKANFIEDELNFRKLGTTGMNGKVFISTFKLESGDLLVMGSDGKDDLVLSQKEGERSINEDERLFLRNFEKADGDLQKVYDVITSEYELMDDLSLLSVRYTNEKEHNYESSFDRELEILNTARDYGKQKNNQQVLNTLKEGFVELPISSKIGNALINSYLKLKNFKEANELSKVYLLSNPLDTKAMIKFAYSYKMLGEYNKAIEILERIRSRDPSNMKNLILLAELYEKVQNHKRFKKLSDEIEAYKQNGYSK